MAAPRLWLSQLGMAWPHQAVSVYSESINQQSKVRHQPYGFDLQWVAPRFFQVGDSINPLYDTFYHGRCQIEKMDDIWVWAMTVGDCLYKTRDGTQDLLLPWQCEKTDKEADTFLLWTHSVPPLAFNEVTRCLSGDKLTLSHWTGAMRGHLWALTCAHSKERLKQWRERSASYCVSRPPCLQAREVISIHKLPKTLKLQK